MRRDAELTPFDFAHQDSVADPQLTPDGRYAAYVLKSSGKSKIVVVEMGENLTKVVYEVPVRSPHPFGGGVSQIAPDGRRLYFVTVTGGISLIDLVSGEVCTVYDGPGVSQITLSGNGCRIAATVFGDRVAVFATQGKAKPIVVSEYPRVLRSFHGLPGRVRHFVENRPDFVFDVTISSNGEQVAWHEWALPDMPWQQSQIVCTQLEGGASPEILICAGGDYFVSQPRFSPSGEKLGFMAETSSYLRLWVADLQQWTAELVSDDALEHAGPPWGNGNRTYSFSSDSSIMYFSRNEAGHGRLVGVGLQSGEQVEIGKAHHFGMSVASNALVAVRSGAKTPNAIVTYDLSTGERSYLEQAYSEAFHAFASVEPEIATAKYSDLLHYLIDEEHRKELASVEPMDIHYRIYRPEGAGEPLGTIATFHGGPTEQALVTFAPRNLAFVQAGFQVLAFDYRGSAGWGQEFRNALNGGFGVYEIVDLLSVLADLVDQGKASPGSIVLNGGSSGGYSALRSLCLTRGLFCGAIAEYPLIDLAGSAANTHRLESRYFDRLLGLLPSEVELYNKRSVSASELDNVPILLMHGDSDNVVDHRHVVEFAEEARALGKDLEFILFPGEGHGFSSPEAIEREFAAYEAFLRRMAAMIEAQSS